jgi:hypothetical protein
VILCPQPPALFRSKSLSLAGEPIEASWNRFAAKECATANFDADGPEDVPMQRMCSVIARVGLTLFFVALTGLYSPVCGDLIRSKPERSFPDIAGDIVGVQTYTYDPISQTGTFAVVNAPHLISLGPSVKDMLNMLPGQDGTLSQSLLMKLDRHGRLIDSPNNKFEIRGKVIIGDKTYEGLLLEGKPTAFGADLKAASSAKNLEMFDLSMRITGGELARAFGDDAYLRIRPQDKSTFDGQFTTDFSSERPLTNLRAFRKPLPTAIPEPTPLITFLTCGAGLVVYKLRRYFGRRTPRRGKASQQEIGTQAYGD